MAVANTKSTAITNDDAIPKVLNQSWIHNAKTKVSAGTIEVAAADDNGSVYRMVRVPSGVRVTSVMLWNDAITGGTNFDVGVYKTAGDGGAVVSATAFASAVDLSTASTSGVQVLFEAQDIANIEKRLWELLGLSVDPIIDYDICLTGNVVGSGAGTISMSCAFVL